MIQVIQIEELMLRHILNYMIEQIEEHQHIILLMINRY